MTNGHHVKGEMVQHSQGSTSFCQNKKEQGVSGDLIWDIGNFAVNGPLIPGDTVEGFQELGLDGKILWLLDYGVEGRISWETERKGRDVKHLAWCLQCREVSINVGF